MELRREKTWREEGIDVAMLVIFSSPSRLCIQTVQNMQCKQRIICTRPKVRKRDDELTPQNL